MAATKKLKKSELVELLKELKIDFPPKATVEELRNIYECETQQLTPPSEEIPLAIEETPLLSEKIPLPSEKSPIPVERMPSPSGEMPSPSVMNVSLSSLVEPPPPPEPVVPVREFSMPSASVAPDNSESLDEQLQILRRKLEIATLTAQLRALENAPSSRRPLELRDLEHALHPFTGDNEYRIRKWVNDYEEILGSGFVDERDKLIFARRMMEGTARRFLMTIKAPDWPSLRDQLIQEFDQQRSRRDVYKQLESRTIKKDETIRQYVLEMQSIASQTDITEEELVQYIVDGLGNLGVNGAAFVNVRTIQQFKSALVFYERRQLRSGNQPQSRVRTSPTPPSGTIIRCVNCRLIGHHESNCTKPRRPPGSCFHCWEMGHQYKQCPKKKTKNVISAVTNDGVNEDQFIDPMTTDTDNLAALQPVSIEFCIDNIRLNSNKIFYALFDTGSPVSFIHKSVVPEELCNGSLKNSQYRGLGNLQLPTYGNVHCCIKFGTYSSFHEFIVVPDCVLPVPVLIGRNLMGQLGVSLHISKPKAKLKKILSLKKECICSVYNSSALLPEKDISINFEFESYYCESNFIDRFPSICMPSELTAINHIPDPSDISHESVEIFNKTIDNFEMTSNAELLIELPYVLCVDEEFQEILDFDVGSGFGKEWQLTCLKLLREKYVSPQNSAPPSEPYFMKLRLTSDTPIYSSPRRLSYLEKKVVNETVDELLNNNIIRPSNSPYAFPIVLVKKKNGNIRLCVDYRPLNKLIIRDNYPLPLIEDCLDYLSEKNCFSLLDLKNGFYHVRMHEDSIPYTSFVVPGGQYEYLRMPFGLRNGPSVFQRFVSNILRDMIQSNEIVVYMDDILVATQGPKEHMRVLEKLLGRLNRHHLEIKMPKCHFLQISIDYLGYLADRRGIRPNGSHVETLRCYPMPTNRRELQSCIGLFSYFRRFVPSFSLKAGPMLDLLKKDSPFKFSKECEKAFFELRNALTSAPVLSIYNPKRDTELHTDASSQGFGAVLLQKQEDGKWHPVSYFSRRTTTAESQYNSFELETLAVIYALRRFRVYLEGISFRIVTDCSSLMQTLSKKSLNPRIARWALELENYDYVISHRNGSAMGHVDALSRIVMEAAFVSQENCDYWALFGQDVEIDLQLSATQLRDPEIAQIREKLEIGPFPPFEMHNGLVYRRLNDEKLALWVPVEMENNVIRLIHEKIGHLSTEKCYNQIRQNYWFPAMRSKLDNYIRNCLRCVMHTPPSRVNERTLHSIPKVPLPFDTIHIDHFGPLPNIINKNKHILVIIDAFTKFVKLYPAKTTSTKEVCAALDKYFSYYGRPRRLICDRGTAFSSNEFREYMIEHNIQLIKTAVAAPQANGQVERVNRVLGRMLSKMVEPVRQSDWPRFLSRVEYAMNNSIHNSTGKSPSILLFGVAQRGPDIDEMTEYLSDFDPSENNRDLSCDRNQAEIAILNSQNRNEKQYHNRSTPPRQYAQGDYVVIRNVDTTIGQNKKFIPKYRGPYVVHKVLPNDRYVIRDVENCQITQIPYNGVLEASRLKPWIDLRPSTIKKADSDDVDADRGRSECQAGRVVDGTDI